MAVIPAKAGIHAVRPPMDARFRGDDVVFASAIFNVTVY